MEALNNGEEETTQRFYKLCHIDEVWADYQPPIYNNTITLEQFCDQFRNFACSRLGLYYDTKLIRYFVASFGSNRLIILQGISVQVKLPLLVHSVSLYVTTQSSHLYSHLGETELNYSVTSTNLLRDLTKQNYCVQCTKQLITIMFMLLYLMK